MAHLVYLKLPYHPLVPQTTRFIAVSSLNRLVFFQGLDSVAFLLDVADGKLIAATSSAEGPLNIVNVFQGDLRGREWQLRTVHTFVPNIGHFWRIFEIDFSMGPKSRYGRLVAIRLPLRKKALCGLWGGCRVPFPPVDDCDGQHALVRWITSIVSARWTRRSARVLATAH